MENQKSTMKECGLTVSKNYSTTIGAWNLD